VEVAEGEEDALELGLFGAHLQSFLKMEKKLIRLLHFIDSFSFEGSSSFWIEEFFYFCIAVECSTIEL
jgi:hypothetical protein